jgi:radical SAM superfamily enzyme YgiQ (UPF0313 family)
MPAQALGDPMNSLLIYPAFPDTFWSFKHALDFIHKKAAYPPLGLLTVASLLPESWPKRLVDLNVEQLSPKDLEWADIAFISAMIVQRESSNQIISTCKKAGLRVVAGGPLFNYDERWHKTVDHVVLNEAEITLPLFLRDLENQSTQHVYKTREYADVRKTPAPMWELIDLDVYASMNIQFSRGCPFSCDFCNVTQLFGHRLRFKSSPQIIAELDELYHLGWRGQVFFVDDNFIGNKRYLIADLLPRLAQWQSQKKAFRFGTEASLNIADDPFLMKLMVDAGFEEVFIGIETPSKDGLIECNKSQNAKRNLLESVKQVQRAGLQVQGGFIVGFDTDGPSIFTRQIEFIQQSGIVTAMVGLLQAPKGTRLYKRLKKQGRIHGSVTGDNSDGTTNIVPKMGMQALLDGYRHIQEYIYRPHPYYQRIKTFLLEYNAPRIFVKIDSQRILAFFRCCIKLGVFGKERYQFWNLLFWTILNRPRFLPLSMTFAIYGYHFRKVCKL